MLPSEVGCGCLRRVMGFLGRRGDFYTREEGGSLWLSGFYNGRVEIKEPGGKEGGGRAEDLGEGGRPGKSFFLH